MISFYEWFNKVILTSANSVPIQSLWVAFFANPIDLNRAIQAGIYENGFGYYTLTDGAAINTAQGGLGALFANSVTIPGEGMGTSKLGPTGSGLIKGNISSGRQDMGNVTLSFLDTNMSFTDYNLRPWSIYASHKSLKDPAVKTTLTIIQFAKSGSTYPLLPRAIWTFHGACPVSISTQEWNYGADNVVSRQVDFAYNYYLLNADPGITAIQTVASIVAGSKLSNKYQPVEVESGSAEGYGNPSIVSPQGGHSSLGNHPEGQQVIIPEDDLVNRGINIGLEILNGNSNVTIASDDAIDRLRIQGEELLNTTKVSPTNDVPIRSKGIGQIGYVEETSHGPGGKDDPDHITRNAPERKKSGHVPVTGNSKANDKSLSDTPIFFPGDGNQNQKKIDGRTVGGKLDTPNLKILKTKQVVVDRTGNVGRNIPLQIININRNDSIDTKVNTNVVTINGKDVVDQHIQNKPVIINSNDHRK